LKKFFLLRVLLFLFFENKDLIKKIKQETHKKVFILAFKTSFTTTTKKLSRLEKQKKTKEAPSLGYTLEKQQQQKTNKEAFIVFLFSCFCYLNIL